MKNGIQLYDKARTNYKKRQVERSSIEKQKMSNSAIEEEVDELITEHRHRFIFNVKKICCGSSKN